MNLQPGDVFDTEFERGCIVKSVPDSDGNFMARDSDGVLCQFNLVMVELVWKATK